MALVTPYNVRVQHTVLKNGKSVAGSSVSPPAGKGGPRVYSVGSPNGSTTTVVNGVNFVSFSGFESSMEFTDVSGATNLTLDQVVAAGGTYQDGVAVIPESLLPDRTQTGLTVVANGQQVVFVIT